MQKNNQSGNTLVIAIIIVAILGLFYFLNQKPTTTQPAPQVTSDTIQNDAALMSVASDLDNTKVDEEIDPGLNQNDADASTL